MALQNNAQGIKAALHSQRDSILVQIGILAKDYARDLAPTDTGRLKQSIDYAVAENTVYVGTNVEYAPYQEFGTGEWCTLGGGTLIVEGKDGKPRKFHGNKPYPFLKPALANHVTEYRALIERMLDKK